ncbi:hypothetical protein THAOC_24286 [Thalassiosira oceanica]|uniref:Uncharacterized protein n=1 Tax=Thalassiosira oceanica TaxID=159749 RepID=K0SAZ2_THAOC|nr:hypothetical protein THAOC_24286 [Thalassiosira oceanica]|eukprot:EJK55922.1 hypothetical protein THAOC_24286 [Thalassiosira oceanica]
MNAYETKTKRRRRLDSSPGEAGVAAAAADVSRDDAVTRLERRINLIEASFQREISEMKRAGEGLVARNKAIESQLSSLQEENERLNAKVSQLHDKNCRLEAAFRAHVENMHWKYDAPDPPPDRYWIEQGYDYGDEGITDQDY